MTSETNVFRLILIAACLAALGLWTAPTLGADEPRPAHAQREDERERPEAREPRADDREEADRERDQEEEHDGDEGGGDRRQPDEGERHRIADEIRERAQQRRREREDRDDRDERHGHRDEHEAMIRQILDADDIEGPARDFLLEEFDRAEDVDFREVWGFIKDHFTPQYREFRELSKRHAEEAIGIMEHLIDETRHLLHMRAENPEEFQRVIQRQELEHESHALSDQYREADTEEERQRIKTQLRAVLDESFDAKQAMLQRELEHLNGELDRLRHIVETREQRRQDIIERRLQELTEGEEVMGW